MIEVGVDVPSANIIVRACRKIWFSSIASVAWEGCRGTSESSCILLYKAPLSENGERRLSILRETEDGFKIARA